LIVSIASAAAALGSEFPTESRSNETELEFESERVVPVLFLAAANRQDMVEAKADIVLPEPQHRPQIVRRKSDVDDVFCELHLPHH
jgi:hypothetical protein